MKGGVLYDTLALEGVVGGDPSPSVKLELEPFNLSFSSEKVKPHWSLNLIDEFIV
mgnify:CR=1 FL=1